MTTTELYQSVVNNLPSTQIHPLHKAMLEECCENALENNDHLDSQTLIYMVGLAFITCDSTLRATMKATLESGNADVITLNYRNQTFEISKNSAFLKSDK